MPLFDPDTNMLFLAGKGDTTILYMEVTEREPHFVEGIRHSGEQTKGGCLVPKRALNVMQAEVNRLLQLTSNMVIPIMYQVPRKVCCQIIIKVEGNDNDITRKLIHSFIHSFILSFFFFTDVQRFSRRYLPRDGRLCCPEYRRRLDQGTRCSSAKNFPRSCEERKGRGACYGM